jgi:catechol 2,3-dioxygenase-like lactoylglutathione lyase family enzyme
MRFRSVRAVTWAVPDVAASAAAFERWLGYRPVWRGEIPPELAAAWGAPASAHAPCQVLQPASGEAVFLRFVESRPTPGYAPLQTFGWNAAELHVGDVAELAQRLQDSPFRILGGPRDLLQNGAVIALQLRGPGDEVLYLTEIRHPGMRQTYGYARCGIGRVFIVVLGVSDQRRSLEFYRPFALRSTERRAFPIRVLAGAHGLDPEQARFDIASLVLEERFRIETDAYPETARPRPRAAGCLPPGLCMVSLTVEGGHPPDTVATDQPAMPPYAGGRAGMLRGPDGEWLELLFPAA